jgi:N-acetyl-anhydromuramyl-L-alanine amidase AmpD
VIDTAVLHASEHEDVESLVHELRVQDHSYHYIVDRDGTIYKGVPFSAIAFHCGNSYGPHEASRGISCERDAAGTFVEHPCVNEYTLGVCLINMNDGVDPYTPEQIKACFTLLNDLKTPLPKMRYLTSHAMVSPGKHSDPVGFDLAGMAKELGLEVWSLEATAV